MKIISCVLIIMSFFSFLPLSVCLALHDDETLKDGGAWRPAEMNVGPDRSDSESRIDTMIDRSFEKSEIVIPPLESEKDKGSGSEESKEKSGDEAEKQN